MKDPLYQGAGLSVFECCTLIMLFVIKHKLTKAALQDLLYLIHTVIPSIGCKMITSVYRVNGLFSKFFGNGAPTLHHMCSNCGKLLKQGKTQCKSSRACKQSGTVKFAELNVEEKLKELFLGKTLTDFICSIGSISLVIKTTRKIWILKWSDFWTDFLRYVLCFYMQQYYFPISTLKLCMVCSFCF